MERTSIEEIKMMLKADRLPPNEVDTLVVGRVSFSVIHWGKKRGLEQNGGYIVATDLDTNKELWVLKVYDTEYDPDMEEDAQDVFITSLSKVWFRNKLKVVNERGEKFIIDLKTQQVTGGD